MYDLISIRIHILINNVLSPCRSHEQEMWHSLPQIQLLSHNLPDHNVGSFTRNYYDDGLDACLVGSMEMAPSLQFLLSIERWASHYQQYQDVWNPHYY